mgnify:CR=1 FL=1|jgi:CheY-like chemotaxis protein
MFNTNLCKESNHICLQASFISKKLQSKNKKKQDRKTILVVEDNKDLQMVARLMLETLLYKVVTVSTGREGLKYLHEHSRTALILLDIMMPEMTGLEFLSIVKQDLVLKKIPIIIQSALTDESIQEGMAMGASGYVQKPYNQETLYAAIKKLNIKGGGHERIIN